jgi:hypothetical protein
LHRIRFCSPKLTFIFVRVLRTLAGRAWNETVTPAKTGGAMAPDLLRCVAHGARFEDALQIGEPGFAFAQARQGRAGQSIEAATASEAAPALQAAGLAAAMDTREVAMRTRRRSGSLRNQGKAFPRMGDGGDPATQDGQLVRLQGQCRQQGKYVVERQAPHRRPHKLTPPWVRPPTWAPVHIINANTAKKKGQIRRSGLFF